VAINPKIALRSITIGLTLVFAFLLTIFINSLIPVIIFAFLTLFFLIVSFVSWRLGDPEAFTELKERLERDLKK
jgi:hypothetical protein